MTDHAPPSEVRRALSTWLWVAREIGAVEVWQKGEAILLWPQAVEAQSLMPGDAVASAGAAVQRFTHSSEFWVLLSVAGGALAANWEGVLGWARELPEPWNGVVPLLLTGAGTLAATWYRNRREARKELPPAAVPPSQRTPPGGAP